MHLGSFNLARLKVLRSLQVGELVAGSAVDLHHHERFVRVMGLTIRSPVFSEFVVILESAAVSYLPQQVTLFETLGKMNASKPSKLVFLLDVSGDSKGEARRNLTRALDLVTAKGFLDFLDSPPTIR